jgi:hypothetical protein
MVVSDTDSPGVTFPYWSSRVTVTVAQLVPLAGSFGNVTTTDDAVALTGPGTNVTVRASDVTDA